MAGFGQTEEVRVQNVTPNYFSLMGAKPRMGRIFFAEEMQDKSIAVVLSDTFWRTKFNAIRELRIRPSRIFCPLLLPLTPPPPCS